SSLMFLEPGEPRRVLAKKVQYLLLLALRIGVLVLLALAFTEPALWRTPDPAGDSDGARLHLIVLDGSASMSYDDRWQRARAAASDVLDSMSGDDRAQIVLSGRQFEVLGPATGDVAALRQTLNTAEPGMFRVEYGQLMRSIDGLLRTAELPVVLDLVTDLQTSGLPTRFGELAPRRPAEIVLHDVTDGPAENWTVDSFGASALTGELTASVRSFAPDAVTRTLTLTQNGRSVGEQDVEIAAGGRGQVTFPALELASGANRVEVALSPGDELEGDDRRYLAIKRPEPRKVLLVAPNAEGRDVLFTRSALETLTTLALTADVRATPIGDPPLTSYSFVVVTDLGVLDASQAAAVQDYVQNGGRALLATGPRSAGLTTLPITGQTLRTNPQMGSQATVAIGEVDASHPVLRGVDELRAANFSRSVNVEPATGDRVLMSLADGTPLLLEQTVGSGRVLLFTSSLGREWNDLPVQPAFVPLMAGIANELLGGAGFTSEADLGSTLAVRALGLAGGQIFDPRGEAALGLGAGSEDVLLDQVGFYEVVGGGTTELVAVNFDPRESDLTPIEATTLDRWRGLGVRPGEGATPVAATTADDAVPRSLGPLLMILLLMLVLVESAVGNWHLRIRRGVAA
ncbi:MAG TPA: VWA domain-containing protein, partial [Gammaproteobacteria bacterium]|nr:VWA domain-containing protein [Gammaproteobacteria bacterium]